MPILPPSDKNPQAGFTLIEMLVVLAIMAMATFLMLGRAGGGDALANDRNLAKIESELAQLRQVAIESGRQQVFEPAARDMLFEPAIAAGGQNLIFFSDGSSNGGALKDNNGQLLFTIGWQAGRISNGR